MNRHQHRGLTWYEFPQPDTEFRHALLTRLGGVSEGTLASLNLGSAVGDAPEAVAENHRRVCSAFDITRDQTVGAGQVHGRNVATVGYADGGRFIPQTDALITNEPGAVLLMRFADCTPVLFYDPVHRAVGLAHAGWRGAAAGVVPHTITALHTAFGTRPEELWAGIGPAIGPEHYAVGPEVVHAIEKTLTNGASIAIQRAGQWYLDLPGAVMAQLRQAGIGQIEPSQLYTAGHTDEWYSHRAEQGRAGRFGVLIMLA